MSLPFHAVTSSMSLQFHAVSPSTIIPHNHPSRRELLDLPDKAIDNAEAFIPAAADAVLDYFKAQRMRGKRGRMPKYKPNEDLKFRDAETFPLAMAALVRCAAYVGNTMLGHTFAGHTPKYSHFKTHTFYYPSCTLHCCTLVDASPVYVYIFNICNAPFTDGPPERSDRAPGCGRDDAAGSCQGSCAGMGARGWAKGAH